MKARGTGFYRVLRGMVLGMFVIALAGCDAASQREIKVAVSNAKPRISNLKADHDARIVNNEMDYGLFVSFTVTNEGDRGAIQVSPWLSTSEGEWSREQNWILTAGESHVMTYFFSEPTINASNIQYGVRTKP